MVAKHLLSDADRARIAQSVQAAEALTSVEIRLVLAHASGHYSEFELIYPALFALLGGGAAAAFLPASGAGQLIMAEATLFAVAALLLQWPALRRALVPGPVKRKAAWRHARLNYASTGLTRRHTRSILLIFTSAAERYVEILVDDAIAEVLPDATWTPIVERLKSDLAAGAIADAFSNAAKSCATLLAPHFPHVPGETNELPDTLEEI